MAETPPPADRKGWLDEPKNRDRLWYTLIALCIVSVLADLFYHKHVHFDVENIPGMYGWWALIACIAMVLVAKVLRATVQRPENYYEEPDE
jgi:uncharacterized membrane protein